jgi:hypothetical protein
MPFIVSVIVVRDAGLIVMPAMELIVDVATCRSTVKGEVVSFN